MEELEIEDLVILAKNGDDNAIKQLLKKFEPLLYKNSIINGQLNEDCLQELTIKFLAAINEFKLKEEFLKTIEDMIKNEVELGKKY